MATEPNYTTPTTTPGPPQDIPRNRRSPPAGFSRPRLEDSFHDVVFDMPPRTPQDPPDPPVPRTLRPGGGVSQNVFLICRLRRPSKDTPKKPLRLSGSTHGNTPLPKGQARPHQECRPQDSARRCWPCVWPVLAVSLACAGRVSGGRAGRMLGMG